MFWEGDKVSVLVKNIKMPENCIECISSDLRTAIKCTEWTEISAGRRENERAWSCPLVEIPEKHGRLIDAEALIDTLEQAIAIMETMLKQLDLEADDGCLMELKAYRDIRDGIKEIDAVIEAEGEG